MAENHLINYNPNELSEGKVVDTNVRLMDVTSEVSGACGAHLVFEGKLNQNTNMHFNAIVHG